MFKSALYHSRNIYGCNIHRLRDDRFEQLVEVDHGGLTFQIIETYRKRELPIAPNLALYYLWYGYSKVRLNAMMEYDRKTIDVIMPSYGKKIYPCVLRQIEQRSFGRAL